MIEEELRDRQKNFEGTRQEIKKEYNKLEKLRKEFINKYSLKKLENISIDEYIVGKGSKDTFCYWLEIKLMELGRIKGGTTAGNKFGIYYGVTKKDKTKRYRFLKKFGNTYLEAYEKIKENVIELLRAGIEKNLTLIKSNKLSPMFKGKILSTYFPEIFLNVFSEDHLDYFIKSIQLDDIDFETLDVIDKRECLFNYKNSDEIMKNWTIFEFGHFLYTQLGRPNKDDINIELKEFIENYPPIEDVKIEKIDFKFEKLVKNSKSQNQSEGIQSMIDFEKQQKRRKGLGHRGELIVKQFEKDYLKIINKKDLAEKVKQISNINRYAGYDIESYDEKGKKKLIEVKSTSNKFGKTYFEFSENQNNKMQMENNYFIYLVFEANTANPKICILRNLYDIEECKRDIKATKFGITLSLKKLKSYSV